MVYLLEMTIDVICFRISWLSILHMIEWIKPCLKCHNELKLLQMNWLLILHLIEMIIGFMESKTHSKQLYKTIDNSRGKIEWVTTRIKIVFEWKNHFALKIKSFSFGVIVRFWIAVKKLEKIAHFLNLNVQMIARQPTSLKSPSHLFTKVRTIHWHTLDLIFIFLTNHLFSLDTIKERFRSKSRRFLQF